MLRKDSRPEWTAFRCLRGCVLGLSLLVPGCRERANAAAMERTCEGLGLCDGAHPVPVTLDILGDSALGSPFSRRALEEVLDQALPILAPRPGSRIDLNVASGSGTGPALLAASDVTGPSRPTTRARTAYAQRFVTTTRAQFLQAAEPVFTGVRPKHLSLAEAIERVAARNTPQGTVHRIVVISAGREVSDLGDFACHGSIPTLTTFESRLRRHQVLLPGTLNGIQVGFAFMSPTSIPGRSCPTSLARTHAIQALWTNALTRAGARSVSYSTGPVAFDDVSGDVAAVRDGGVR